ncbi:MAG: LPP20 family lipoprotein [Nitrospirae bacterium]|nr:LPP20 family lipoprotein [Nitrospirota bacterium]
MKKTIKYLTLSSLYVLLALLITTITAPAAEAQLGPQQRLMAKRAAKVDALRNLAEIIYGVQINSQTKVKDFITESDTIRARLATVIQGAREVDYVERPDGTAEVTVEINLGRVEDILGRRLIYDQQVFTAVGYGAPGGEPARAYEPAPAAPMNNVIRAKGNGVEPNDPSMSPPEKTLMGKRAAKIDALRNLLEQVYGVTVKSKTTVRDFVTQSDDMKARVSAFVRGARVVAERSLGDGSYEVEVELELDPLMGIISGR